MIKYIPYVLCCVIAFACADSAYSDTESDKNGPIPVLIDVPESTFVMGRSPEMSGESDELPQHTVTLGAHQIGKYEVSNAQYAAVLNWALEMDYLQDDFYQPYTKNPGNVYVKGRLIKVITDESQIIFNNGRFTPITRDGLFMDNHPVVDVTWNGAVAYVNWLSEIRGLTPCYDLGTFTRITPVPDGYRLPTEAEWEHASGWQDPEKETSWSYANSSHEITIQQGNFQLMNPMHALGMASYPYTSAIGYFDGQSPDTVNSVSPIGCYDMSGNVQEWCEDWFSEYTEEPKADPAGPDSGTFKIVRGGGWNSIQSTCRTTNRGWTEPFNHFRSFGFRIARSL